MKVTILSGSDTPKIYLRAEQILKAIRARGWEVLTIDPDKNIAEQFKSTSLFDQGKIFLIDNSKVFNPKNLKWLKDSGNFDANLLVIAQGSLPIAIKNVFPKANIENFDIPKKIFIFLESIFPGNAKNCLTLLHEIVESEPVELVFALISTHLRDLYWVKIDPSSYTAPDWKKEKLTRQAQKFNQEKLENLIKAMAKADIEAKTSQLPILENVDLVLLTGLK